MASLRIGVCLDLREPLSRQVLATLGEAARSRTSWSLRIEGYGVDRHSELLACDLLVVRDWQHLLLRQRADRRRAIVLSGEPLPDAHRVWSDDRAIGIRAARHLLERGYRQLAFRSDQRFASFRGREEGFVAEAAAGGVEAMAIPAIIQRRWSHAREAADAIRRLAQIDRPLGLAAYDAPTTRRLAEYALAAGMTIPDDLALIACSDDPLMCALGHPTLSAIHLPLDRIARAVVDGLDELAQGRRPAGPVLIAPDQVIERGSSGYGSAPDAVMAAARRMIVERDLDPGQVAARLRISRRSLERRFQQEHGCGPGTWAARQRMDCARTRLRDTSAAIAAIARACGYASHAAFCHAFQRQHGQSPAAWRAAATGR